MSKQEGKWIEQGVFVKASASGNGVTTDFVLPSEPHSAGALDVFIDGLLRPSSDYTLTLATKTVAFGTAPAAAQNINFKYVKK